MSRMMIVEDDLSIRNELIYLLKQNGYEAFGVTNFNNVLGEINSSDCDLVILDINIPNMDGKYILKELRKTNNIPVIMVTSSNTDIDEIMSINYGADDYVTKPYNPEILLLRIEAVLRRSSGLNEIISYRGVKLNVSKSEMNGLALSKNELNIFLCLYKNIGKIVSRDDLIDYLWNSDEFVDDNTLTVNINRLRSKLSSIGLNDSIETRRGQGYILL